MCRRFPHLDFETRQDVKNENRVADVSYGGQFLYEFGRFEKRIDLSLTEDIIRVFWCRDVGKNQNSLARIIGFVIQNLTRDPQDAEQY